jgi:hypothetical protein
MTCGLSTRNVLGGVELSGVIVGRAEMDLGGTAIVLEEGIGTLQIGDLTIL